MRIIFAITILFLIFSFNLALAEETTISCATGQYPWCKEEAKDPAGLINSFYKIALGLVGAAAFGVLIYGAILWTLSGAVTSKQDAKEWISGALWGLVLLLGAYIILKTINPELTILKNPEIKEVSSSTSSSPSSLSSSSSPLPYKDSKSAAYNLWAVSRQNQVFLGTSADCMSGSDAKSIIEDAAAGKPIMVCSSGCSKTSGCERKNIGLNPDMLNTTAQISASSYTLKVTSLTGGDHSSNSAHYRGEAIDVVPTSNNPNDWNEVVSLYNQNSNLEATCDLGGKFYTDCSKIVGQRGAHIHVSVKKR